MTNDTIREHCLGLPHVTEVVQWEDHLLFKVGGKMFAIIALEGHSCNFKCTPEKYGELVEMADIVPSSHNMWKYNWVTTETLTALADPEFRELLTASYRLVRAGLPKKAQAELEGARTGKIAPAKVTRAKVAHAKVSPAKVARAKAANVARAKAAPRAPKKVVRTKKAGS